MPPAATPPVVAPGHVHLILSHSIDSFYLEIPISVIQFNSVHPIKYLRFLGWCVIGILGTVKSDRQGSDLANTAPLQDQGRYFYIYNAPDDNAALQYAVDPEILKTRSNTPTVDTAMRNRAASFKQVLVNRDAKCVFTGWADDFCEGSHIIPFHKGDEWFELIVKNRPRYGEDVSTLTKVDDPRNGILLDGGIHRMAELKRVVVLKTPNTVLSVNDIPARHTRNLADNVKYPDGQRYTAQWLEGADPEHLARLPNNSDAAFRKHTHIHKPSPLLLHYNYGVAAVKWWGQGKEHLGIQNRPAIPRPSVPVRAATGPDRTKRTAEQLAAVTEAREMKKAGGSGSGPKDNEAERDHEVMSPDEVVMFFWSRNPAALERRKREAEDRQREEDERASRMEEWRHSVVAI
ncbi:hypothetical protein B0H11DRAFT_2006665 [Mycena galericulata]|nr:hypothetical protein B0H11DRAFT_2006665 [Mycena galericulata]